MTRLSIRGITAFTVAALLTLSAAAQSTPNAAATGSIRGQVYDRESGRPVPGVAVRLVWPSESPNAPAREDKATSDAGGDFAYEGIEPGTYRLRFSKEGFVDAEMARLEVRAGVMSRADFALAPEARAASADDSDVELMIVEASAVEDIMAGLDLRMQSDQLLNVMGAEEFAKFAAGDVADALKRVSGVNVVGGQFAIIRGLEDRYSSTTFNGAPVPSPDPDRQSVQLDLFASDIVSSVQIAKTFGANQPSNSAGGSIDIVTMDYPGEFQFKLNLGTGFNGGAIDRFQDFVEDSPVGRDRKANDTIERDIGGSVGGRFEAWKREFRYRALLNHEIDYDTRDGFQERREPIQGAINQRTGIAVQNGDLAFGRLSLSNGRFDLFESRFSDVWTAFGAFGLDLDEAAAHRVDFTAFYSKKTEETVSLRENGFIPGVDYAALRQRHIDKIAEDGPVVQPIGPNDFECCGLQDPVGDAIRIRESLFETPARGALWFTNYTTASSFDSERDLLLLQLNGDHRIGFVPGLGVTWVGNYAKTTDSRSAFRAKTFFEPDEKITPPLELPASVAALGPGNFAVPGSALSFSTIQIEEDQWFARLDAKYERSLLEWARIQLDAGGWYERAGRDVSSDFLESPLIGGSSQFAIQAPTLSELGSTILDALSRDASGRLNGLRATTNSATREVLAWALQGKTTLFDDLDLLAGVRIEQLRLEATNDAFTGQTTFDGTPAIFPSKYLFLDRADNPARNDCFGTTCRRPFWNDQILAIPVNVDPLTGFVDLPDRASIEAALSTPIDEDLILPHAGITYRPIPGLVLRGAFSKTAARPSLRERAYYVTIEPGADERTVGNPLLGISRVTSEDLRAEYTWGDFGDLAALSVFYKEIEDPIEKVRVADFSSLQDPFATFFNNPNTATLVGAELELRKNLEFLGLDFLEFFSIGANATYIHARVERSSFERQFSADFFADVAPIDASIPRLSKRRRLYGQPEWIANADITFDQEDWGTKLTLSAFAISSILDTAGGATQNPAARITGFVLDRYLDSYYQLDLSASQTWYVERLRGDLTFKVSVKNLSDSTRRLIYDREQTASRIAERSYKVGRDYSFSLGYTF